jgi:hypothetical protein
VVIVTKIHSSNHLDALEQSLCLLHYAYNNRVNYDIIVFSTEYLNETQLEPVRKVIAPAQLIFVVDNPGLQQRVDSLPDVRKQELLARCNVTSSQELHWYMYCKEDNYRTWERLAYTWQVRRTTNQNCMCNAPPPQVVCILTRSCVCFCVYVLTLVFFAFLCRKKAEFRALHIWTMPVLAKYKYMMWLDTDGFCTRVWQRDPIAFMIQNDLALFFDHFDAGKSRGVGFQERYTAAFGQTLCNIRMVNGRLTSQMGGTCPSPTITQVHGFFHITNLDFYRSEPVMKWNRILIGNTTFSRRFDDQIGVTVPAAVLAPERSWEMEQAGLKLDVFHNYKLDGKYQVGGFLNWWNMFGQSNFTEAYGNCRADNRGR